MAKERSTKTPRLFVHFFCLFPLVFGVFALLRSFSHFMGCLFLTALGRPFAPFRATRLLPFGGYHLDSRDLKTTVTA